MSSTLQTPYQLLKSYFTLKYLKEIYDEKIKLNPAKGIDRISGVQFERQAKSHIKIIHEKCLNGTYRFSPYFELLKSKGRGKAPRIIAIPTVRDRIVLYALKEILCQIFNEFVPRKLANTYIYEIRDFLSNKNPSDVAVFQADIKNFYGTIDREILFEKLHSRIKSQKVLTLIRRAIETPIVPKNYRKYELEKYVESIGIPQGLSISNILAAIYFSEVDLDLEKSEYVYFRYVDDILIFTTVDKVNEAQTILKTKVESLKLSFNEDKTGPSITGKDGFEYLGYRFELPKVTMRQATIDKFINSIAAKFSSYIHNNENKLRKYKYLNAEKLKEIFILDLNEKITGAISEKKPYGWVFYYSAINDISVLYKIDKLITEFFKRLKDFDGVPPVSLKKLSRAFYEAKHNPKGGYIHNYNAYQTVEHKRDFLAHRGRLDPDKPYSEEEINELYERVKQRNLSELENDEAQLY